MTEIKSQIVEGPIVDLDDFDIIEWLKHQSRIIPLFWSEHQGEMQ